MSVPKYFRMTRKISPPWGYVGGYLDLRNPQKKDPDRPSFYAVEKWPKSGEWPMLTQSSNGFILLTDEGKKLLETSGLTGVRVVRLLEIRMGEACSLPKVQMWILAPTGNVYIDWGKSCVALDGMKHSYPVRMIPEKNQPHALDFSLTNGEGASVVCSMRSLDFFRAVHWKGIEFRPIDIDLSNMWTVSPTAKKWPPQWYPDGVEPHPNNLAPSSER